jgi:hypothetical protein
MVILAIGGILFEKEKKTFPALDLSSVFILEFLALFDFYSSPASFLVGKREIG